MIAPHLRLQPGQQELTPEQEAEAQRFAEAYIQAQLSTEPVDEPEAETFLRQAYAAARLDPPQRIHWVDGPLQLLAVRPPSSVEGSVEDYVGIGVQFSVGAGVEGTVRDRVGDYVYASVWGRVHPVVTSLVANSVGGYVQASVWDSVGPNEGGSVAAYDNASWLAIYQFFDTYLAPNALHALAHFNARVSGYWLGQNTAVVVRRPAILARDRQGRLHSATGTCLEYHDGWGFYAWHGVRVPEQVILAPERLTREDFLHAEDVEVRRVIQERMGSRFVIELGGVVIDHGARGTLYEVALPDDPERVARYLQVQDASTPRMYFLRVPPTVQTAAEAVAWTFQVGVEDYHPTQET